MAIFGRITARQRLRRATRESLAVPAFSSPVDCTPWVTGGLWPAELSPITDETATLAECLKADLQRIANRANDELKIVKRAGMSDLARQAAEARVIDEARARAARRVESTIRQLHALKAKTAVGYPRTPIAGPVGSDLDKTQVIPAVTELEEAFDAGSGSGRHAAVPGRGEPRAPGRRSGADAGAAVPGTQLEETQVIPAVTEVERGLDVASGGGRHAAVVVGRDESEPARHPVGDDAAVTAARPRPHDVAGTDSDVDRLGRLLEFVVRQEPRLNWAVGDRADGTTVLVTDLAHGWIPAGIALPAGVRLLEPERRTGRASALIGDATRVVSYAPGDSLRRSAHFAATKSSLRPRELPAIDDLARVLSEATRMHDGLPRIVHRLAEAAAAGTGIVDQEVDVLRVHLDTARYQLLVQYPEVDPGQLLKCLLFAATEAIASGDSISANYHLAWYRKLAASPPGRRAPE